MKPATVAAIVIFAAVPTSIVVYSNQAVLYAQLNQPGQGISTNNVTKLLDALLASTQELKMEQAKSNERQEQLAKVMRQVKDTLPSVVMKAGSPGQGGSSVAAAGNIKVTPIKCKFNGEVFNNVYRTGMWSGGRPAESLQPSYYYSYGDTSRDPFRRSSLSGLGSNLGVPTVASLQFLRDTINKKSIQTMVDIPCGDVNWQMSAWEVDSLKLYVGLDVASVVIDVDKQRFAHHSNKLFMPWDFTVCDLPRLTTDSDSIGESETFAFDLIHVRDVLQHLPLAKAKQALCRVMRSGAKYLVSTTFPEGNNENVYESAYYANNLQQAPFNLPDPESCVWTHYDIEKDKTCLWNIPGVSSSVLTELCDTVPALK